MTNKTVVIPIYQDYPFNSIQQQNSRTTVQAKKSLEYGKESRFAMKEKIRMLKNLGFQNLIGLESTTEEEDMINLYFQYVPNKFQTMFKTIQDPEIINKIRESMLSLAQNLVNHCIEHEFKVANIGLDKRNNLKYFLGFNFKIDRNMKKEVVLKKYKQIVESFFIITGKTSKLTKKESRNEYYETMDTTWKINAPYQDHPNLCQHNLMKKSSTVPQNNIIQSQDNSPKDAAKSRYTFDGVNELIVANQQNNHFDEEQRAEIKPIRMEELGVRINKLKSFMKEVTGKTPTNNSGISKFTVKVDENNADNKIYQQNKIMITPNYTKFQNKIAEFRQSKLYRAYNEREILYSKDNQGYKLHTTHNIQNNQSPEIKTIQTKSNQLQIPKSPKNILKLNYDNKNVQMPDYLLQRKQVVSVANSKENSLIKSKNFDKEQDPHAKQYRMLAEKDKYCEQFLFFLEDQSQQPAIKNNNNTKEHESKSRVRERINEHLGNSRENALQIQDRVKNAIRNSIKLINNLKATQI